MRAFFKKKRRPVNAGARRRPGTGAGVKRSLQRMSHINELESARLKNVKVDAERRIIHADD